MEIDDREILARWMIENGYATGHGDSIANLVAELAWQHTARFAAHAGETIPLEMNPTGCGCVCHQVGLFGLMCCSCTRLAIINALDELVNGIEPLLASPCPPPPADGETVARLQNRIMEMENREASVCPEDVGCDEYIPILERRVAALVEALKEAQEHITQCDCVIEQPQKHALKVRVAAALQKAGKL